MAYSDAMLKSMVVNELTARIKLALGRHKSWQASVVQYGGEPADVIEMMKVQNCNCGICGKGLDNVPKWEIDHDHNLPVKPRGLLCRDCNSWLGNYEQMARSAVKYISETPYGKI